MATNVSKIQHLAGPLAVALGKHIDGVASSADFLCRSGFPGPIAIEIARQQAAGVGNARILFEHCEMSIPDAAVVAAAITAAGAK